MTTPDLLSHQGHRLLQLGVTLFLFTSIEGFFVPYFAASNLGRSVHTLAAFSGVLCMVMGLAWPRLDLGTPAARTAFWFLIYSDLATIAAFVMGAIWGAGNSIIPLAADGAHGTAIQEAAINVVMYSAAPTGLPAFALILFGLRAVPTMPQRK